MNWELEAAAECARADYNEELVHDLKYDLDLAMSRIDFLEDSLKKAVLIYKDADGLVHGWAVADRMYDAIGGGLVD